MASRYSTVEEYLASIDAPKAATIKGAIDYILKRFPELQPKIAWNVPMVQRRGEYVAGISALKNHISFSPWSPRVLENHHALLKGYVVKANLFQLPIDWKIDKKLLDTLIQARLDELDEEAKLKTKARGDGRKKSKV